MACRVLEEYLSTLPADIVSFFPSSKSKEALSERALSYIINQIDDVKSSRKRLEQVFHEVSDNIYIQLFSNGASGAG